MRLQTCLNANRPNILAKNYNVLFGVSLGNKYFTKENLRSYIEWIAEFTHSSAVVLIPDTIHVVNYEIRLGLSPERSRSLAEKRGKQFGTIIKKYINETESDKKLCVLYWSDVENIDSFRAKRDIIFSEFNTNASFYNSIITIVKDTLPSAKEKSHKKLERLAGYVLEELPVLVAGLEYNNTNHLLIPYPGISAIDHLAVEIQTGKSFPELTKKLNISEKGIMLELYV